MDGGATRHRSALSGIKPCRVTVKAHHDILLQIISSVELFNIVSGRRSFSAPLPKPLYGGSLTLAGPKLFYVGGVDPYGEPSDMAYEYVPRASGVDFHPDNTGINSFWKEHKLNISSRTSIAVGYSM